MAEKILVGLAIAGIIYNTIVTHVTMKNELCHLRKTIEDCKERIVRIEDWILDKKV